MTGSSESRGDYEDIIVAQPVGKLFYLINCIGWHNQEHRFLDVLLAGVFLQVLSLGLYI